MVQQRAVEPDDTPPRARPRLSRPAIAEAALKLIDDGGMPALTMRRLGQALGVEAMSLYEYVANKDEILEDILGSLFNEVELPDQNDRPWEELACELFCAFRCMLLAHPHAVTLVASRAVQPLEALAPIEMSLGIFRRAGFGRQGAVDAHRVLQSFTIGYLLAETSVLNDPTAVPNSWGTAAYALRELPADTLPHLSELAQVAIDRVADEQFPALLMVIISGLRTELRPEPGTASPT